MDGISGAGNISAHGNKRCAIVNGSAIWCWGQNGSAGLGDGQINGVSNAPVQVLSAGMGAPLQIDAGEDHICALDANGDVWCWGDNREGQLGTGAIGIDETGVLTPF